MRRYNPKVIEPKWQQVWEETGIYKAVETESKPKKYILEYFPYPSGVAMHVGHVRNYTIGDAVSRFARMQGNNVLHPMGWDAFGLPAENFAIKNNITPRESNVTNIKTFKKQLMQMGFSYDWSREIDSSSPDYYKWTQWLFLRFYEKGLAYRAKSLQNWCPQDQTVLANEQVVTKDGVNVCERDGTPVIQKEVEQWFLKITDYADRLVDDLDNLDWPEGIKAMQRNWIGRSEGMIFTSPVKGSDMKVQTFSAHFEAFRADTFVVIAPDHPLLAKLVKGLPEEKAVLKFAEKILEKRVAQGFTDDEHVEGIFTGRYVEDPVGNGDLPIWVASYALAHYGTGIIKCSAHDDRDFKFAKKYGIKLKPILLPTDKKAAQQVKDLEVCYTDMKNGVLTEPSEFEGRKAEEARSGIVDYLIKNKLAEPKVSYKLRDWSVSRQRYWGCPIPIIYCDKDGTVHVPEEDLPVRLPEDVNFKPTGQSPLKDLPEFVNVKCPKCGDDAKRETDTFDTFMDSSWYFLRFTDPHNDKEPFSKQKADNWLPVDNYIGGAEHAVVHLLYSRFWTKFLKDNGYISVNEPFKALRNHGMIGGADGRKMGKRYDNSITPDELIASGYGADALRLYELFMGPYDQGVDWNPRGIAGTYRFLDRFWTLAQEFIEEIKNQRSKIKVQNSGHNAELEVQIQRIVNKTIKKVSQDLEELGFNTAIAALMECVNELYKIKSPHNFELAHDTWKSGLIALTQLLAPFAPHITEELWEELGQAGSVHVSKWPAWDESLITDETMTLAVQINGKVRAEIEVPTGIGEAEAIQLAKTDTKVMELLTGKEIKKAIYVPGRLVSLVVQ